MSTHCSSVVGRKTGATAAAAAAAAVSRSVRALLLSERSARRTGQGLAAKGLGPAAEGQGEGGSGAFQPAAPMCFRKRKHGMATHLLNRLRRSFWSTTIGASSA